MNSDDDVQACPGARHPSAKTNLGYPSTSAVPPRDNNWRWARHLEMDQRVAEAQIKKEEALAIEALRENAPVSN
jgi:hypothetical protein